MIEVEKKFQPTAEELLRLLEGTEFVGEKVLHDVYYDYPDYSLFKKDVRFRNRNGSFELKVGQKSGVAEEIEHEDRIKKYFNTELSLPDFISQNMIPFIDYSTKRKKYIKGEFTIDVDELSYGFNLIEIELLINDESQINEAEQRIIQFAESFNIKPVSSLLKRNMYLKLVKPELYKQLYG